MVKSMFQIYELSNFLYRQKEDNKLIKKMKKDIRHEKPRITWIVKDIAVLLEGDIKNIRYSNAFHRYSKQYTGFSDKELFEYARYLCKTFKIALPNARIPREREFKPNASVMARAIEQEVEQRRRSEGEELPF